MVTSYYTKQNGLQNMEKFQTKQDKTYTFWNWFPVAISLLK